MDRGYSIVQKENEVINSINNINLDDKVDIRLKDGDMKCIVQEIINNKNEV